jgi:hypothetical protein
MPTDPLMQEEVFDILNLSIFRNKEMPRFATRFYHFRNYCVGRQKKAD